MDGLDLETSKGRLVVDEYMAVPGASGVYACGDCAAVPDLTRPGQVSRMTAQHAQRQGRQVGKNVAASLGAGTAQPYKHHDPGFLVDLGGMAAAINPLHIPLSGPPVNALTRGYEGDVLTSAGLAAGIDLCVPLVRADYGSDAAIAMARYMVVASHRDGGLAPAGANVPLPPGDSLAATCDWALEHLDEPLTVAH